MKSTTKAHLALIATNIFFAINFTAVKALTDADKIGPLALNFIRMASATALLWLIYLVSTKKETIQRTHYKRLFWCSLTGIFINQILFIQGLSMTLPIHASLLMLTTPVFIAVLSVFFFKEPMTVFRFAGLASGIAGATMLILFRKNTGNASAILLGDLLVIVNAISYSYYFILVKPLMKRYNPMTVVRICFTIGTALALPLCWNQLMTTSFNMFTPTDWLILILICVGGTFFAYLFNIYGIQQLGPAVSGAYIYTQPVFAAIIAYFFRGDQLDIYALMAASLIFTGVYVVNRSAKKSTH